MTRGDREQLPIGRPRIVARGVFTPSALRALPVVAVIVALLLTALALAPTAGVHAAAPYSVTGTGDEDDAGACTNSAITSGAGADGQLSLREAICEANNAGGAQTISVPSGTYNLGNVGTSELQVGSASGANITITGAGAAITIIHQMTANQRVFDLDFNAVGSVSVSMSGVTISGGTSTAFGGGGILAGWTGDNTTLDHVIITGNTTSGGNQGGGIGYGGGGDLTITNSTISNNASDQLGGGIAFNQSSNSGNLTISSSTISGNTVTNAGGGVGGALSVTGNNTVTISGSTFTNNTLSGGSAANQHGGAIEIEGGTLNLSFSRIVGNTAGNGKGLYIAGGATANATNNWWGCNGGPGAAGCDDTQGPGSISTNPYLKLTLTADATQLDPNASTGVHARTTINSNGVDTSGTGHIPDSPTTPNVAFAGTLGTVSPGSVALASGLASSTFTAGGTPGSGSASAALDNATASVSITVNNLPTPTATATSTPVPPTSTATSTNTPTNTVTPTNTPTQTPLPTDTSTNTPTNTATGTPTNTATATDTATVTDTATSTPVPPTSTATNTLVPPTNMPTSTSVPSTATATSTPVPPTSTPTAPPATATATSTTTAPPATATATSTTTATTTAVATSTATPALVIHNNPHTVVGGRVTPCDLKKNTNGAHQRGCGIVSGVWLPGAIMTYTLSFADGTTLSFVDTTDRRGHSLHPFAIRYLPPVGAKHGQPATVAWIHVDAKTADGSQSSAAALRFAVIR